MNLRHVAAGTSALAVLSLAACGGSSGGGNLSAGKGSGGGTSAAAINSAASKAQITALYGRFFNEPQAQAVTDLQDGAMMGKAIKIAAKLKGKSNTEQAKVSKVTISTTTKPPTATVIYSLVVNGKASPVSNSTGYAVYQNGKWLFARTTFCQLVGLGIGKTPPGCQGT